MNAETRKDHYSEQVEMYVVRRVTYGRRERGRGEREKQGETESENTKRVKKKNGVSGYEACVCV